jgi:hypothetical protein
MIQRTDILVEETQDLSCVDGDMEIGASDDQHVSDILYASPGHYTQAPLTGASIMDAINGSLTGELKNKININLESDGYRTTDIDKDEEAWELNPGNLIINVNYERQ